MSWGVQAKVELGGVSCFATVARGGVVVGCDCGGATAKSVLRACDGEHPDRQEWRHWGLLL